MNDSPKATHYGVWILNEEKDVKIECYVMDTRETSSIFARCSKNNGTRWKW